MNKNIKKISFLVVILVVLNIINQSFYKRLDLTADKRYTLSKTTNSILSKVDKPLYITVYLEGDFPSEFKRLQVETRQYLDELSAENSNIKIHFENPDNQREDLIKKGMMPSQLTVEEDGKLSEAIIFPWAEINFEGKTKVVSLLPTSIVASQEEQLKKAIENLEFLFSDAIYSITKKQQKTIAFLTGNGQLEDIYLISFLSKISKKYGLAKFTLDAVAKDPEKTLEGLHKDD